MGSIRSRPETGQLFMDFKFQGRRMREQTVLPDTRANHKRLQKALDRIETEIALGSFDYTKTFGKPLPLGSSDVQPDFAKGQPSPLQKGGATPVFHNFATQWFAEAEVGWRRSYVITQRGALDKYLVPYFGDKEVGQIAKADVLAFRASLAKVISRKSDNPLSNRRINSVMKPLRQILTEAADRFEFTSPFRNIKPLKMKRSDVVPFSLEEVQRILTTVRADFQPYFTVRFFTGMRTGEAHGLKWKYVDFERRLILVRESIVLGEEDELKTDESMRDIQMNDLVFDALQAQWRVTGDRTAYVFCGRYGQPIDNQNFLNRVWAPLLRLLGYPHRRAYQMRHTAATLWLASGEAPEWIARQLGHTSTEMLFRIYSRYVPNLTRRDGSAMERMLKQHLSLAPVTAYVREVEPRPPAATARTTLLGKPVKAGFEVESRPASERDHRLGETQKRAASDGNATGAETVPAFAPFQAQNQATAQPLPSQCVEPPITWPDVAARWQSASIADSNATTDRPVTPAARS